MYSQGYGACFGGRYRYAKGYKVKLAQHIGSESKGDKIIHAIARDLTNAQRQCGYRAVIDIEAKDRYMSIACEDVTDWNDGDGEWARRRTSAEWEEIEAKRKEITDAIADALKSFAHWIWLQLDAEYTDQNSDEQIDESIRANEYEFTEDGRRA